MEILFCDLCDASVPAADVERGTAARRDGRWHCARCLAAARRRGTVRVFVLCAALLAAATAGAAGAVLALLPRVRGLESEVAGLRRPAVPAPRAEQALREEIRGLSGIAREHATALKELGERIRGDLAELSGAVQTLAARLDTLAAEHRDVKEKLAGLLAREAPAPVLPPEPAAGEAGSGLDVDFLVSLLDDDDAGRRLSALAELEGTTDPRVLAKVRGLLDDSDPFVRAQAARMVGQAKDKAALPALLGLLSDENVRVRAVANEAVTAIAGPIAGYDPTDPSDVREAALKAWRER